MKAEYGLTCNEFNKDEEKVAEFLKQQEEEDENSWLWHLKTVYEDEIGVEEFERLKREQALSKKNEEKNDFLKQMKNEIDEARFNEKMAREYTTKILELKNKYKDVEVDDIPSYKDEFNKLWGEYHESRDDDDPCP